MTSPRSRLWRVPIILAALILSGLLSALLGEHVAWKALGWIGLFTPLATIVWFAWLRPRA